jgi:nitrite reductase/ring-hydroxylating ferredoxin subunit
MTAEGTMAQPMAAAGGFVTVARAAEIAPGTVRVVELDGRSLCVGLTEDGEWGAIDNVCTHDGGVLGEGELDDTGVECPRHGGRFDLFSGRVLSLPPVRPVRPYAARQMGDEIQVELPK